MAIDRGPAFWLLVGGCVGLCAAPSRAEQKATTETILFIRHGEKNPKGLGQLSCRGLNRSLALPAVLKQRYGHLDAVFAPDPAHAKQDGPLSYDYMRALATVEPTAVLFGLPVHAAIGYEEGAKLGAALVAPEFRSQIVLVSWEHHKMEEIVADLLQSHGGQRSAVPAWPGTDFDSIWRVTITWTGDEGRAAFASEHQGLDGESDVCPNLAAPPIDAGSPLTGERK